MELLGWLYKGKLFPITTDTRFIKEINNIFKEDELDSTQVSDLSLNQIKNKGGN